MLDTLERIGGLLVCGQAALMLPSLYRLYRDRRVEGISLLTMSFYTFASLWYLPIYWTLDLWFTFVGVAAVAITELAWCIGAGILIWRSRNG